MDHKLDWTENGNGNMGSITPTCPCGWTGSPEHNYNDDQITSARRQWQHHMRQVSQLGAGRPVPVSRPDQTPKSLTELLVSLMPGTDDRRMWRDYMASTLEQVAATDDLSLLRAAKGADDFEVIFMDFVSNFPGVEVVPAPEGGFYGFMLGLVKLDRDARGEVLHALAAELRKS